MTSFNARATIDQRETARRSVGEDGAEELRVARF
jgi:hypothetical protein